MRTVGLVVAILLGIAAVVGVLFGLNSLKHKFHEPTFVQVAVAARSIAAGETLTEDMVAFRYERAEALTDDDMPPDMLVVYMGRKAREDIDSGSPILARHFVERFRQ